MKKILAIILMLSLLLIGVGCDGEDKEIEKEKEVGDVSLKSRIDDITKGIDVLKYNTIADEMREGEIVQLELDGGDSGTIRLLTDSAKIIEEIFKQDEVTEVQLLWYGNLVDSYGKVLNEKVLKIIIKEETAEKIGWDLFDVKQFENISDSYWIHNAHK